MAAEVEEQVGDSSESLLVNFQRSARELLRSALLEQRGGSTHSSTTENTTAKQAALAIE